MVCGKYLIAKGIKKLCNPPTIKNSRIDRTSRVGSGGHVVNSSVKRYSYIGNNTQVIHTRIGGFTSIGDNGTIGGSNHPIKWVSTSPVFHKGKNILRKHFAHHPFPTTQLTIIGNDVWIGKGVYIKSGIYIGNGAIIGMGSVVTKDVEPYTIVAGNPARVIRKRFDKETIERLLKSHWWRWGERRLKAKARCFNNISKFTYGKVVLYK